MREGYEWDTSPGPAWGLGSILESFRWEQTRAEVEEECQARIAIVGMRGVGKSSLLNRLRGWEVSAPGDNGHDAILLREDLGFFVLVDLPDDASGDNLLLGDDLGYDSGVWSTLTEADLILFLLDGEALLPTVDLRAEEYRWFCRVRSLGRPLLVALNKVDLLAGQADEFRAELERRLAGSVLLISAQQGTGIETGLLPRLLDACPELAVPLGREMPMIRRRAANQLVRRTALLSGLMGLEPVPLLDIPIQLAAQMRMLLKLAALHGRLEPGDGSREMLVAVAGGLGARLAAQQAAKLVPVLGWVVSGLLSGLTTWVLGQAAIAYFDGSLEDQVSGLRRLRRGSRKHGGKARSLPPDGDSEECVEEKEDTRKRRPLRFRLPWGWNGQNHPARSIDVTACSTGLESGMADTEEGDDVVTALVGTIESG